MATKVIPWNTGTGNITLAYTGQGNDTVTVSSDPNDVYENRSQKVTFKTSNNEVSKQVTVVQDMKHPNFKTADGFWFLTADNKYFNVKDE